MKNEAAIPPDWLARGYNHIGDIDIVDGIIYAPVEQPDHDRAKQAMFRFDAATLRFLDAVEVTQHHNSFVSVDVSSTSSTSPSTPRRGEAAGRGRLRIGFAAHVAHPRMHGRRWSTRPH